MASDRQNFYGESTGEQTTSSTSYVDRMTLTFTPDDSSDYVMFATAQVDNDSGTLSALTRFLNDTDSVEAFEESSKHVDSYHHTCGMLKETYGVSPGSKDFKWQAKGVSTNTAGIKEMRICAIKLDAADEYAESLGESTSTSDSPVTKVTLTFTPATTGDYLIIYSAVEGSSGASTNGANVTLTHSGTDYSLSHTTGDFGLWFCNVGMVKLNLANSSQTFILTFNRRSASGTAKIRTARILALRLDQWHSIQYKEQFTQQTNTTTTYADAISDTFTPTGDNYLTLYNLQNGQISGGGTTEGQARNGGTAEANDWVNEPGGANARTTFFFFKKQILAPASTTFDIRHREGASGNTSKCNSIIMALLQLDESSLDTVSDRFSMLGF